MQLRIGIMYRMSKSIRLTGLFALFMLLAAAAPTFAQADLEQDTYAGSVLCAPYVEGECLSLGPNAFIKRMAEQGIRLPFEPLAGSKPDYTLAYLPYLYGQVVTPRAPVYGSAEDASRAANPIYRMEGDLLYVSYEYTEILNEMRVYMIAPGVWMNALDVHRIGPISFQGLQFSRTPRNPFGWVLNPVEKRSDAGYGPGSGTGKWLNRLDIVQSFGFRTVDGVEWVKVSPTEWVEKRFVGLVRPMRQAPSDAITGKRWVDVNLYEQTVAVYENNQLVFATIISSGIDPFWTRPGLFQVREKVAVTPMSGAFEADRSDYYYLEDVPWAMYFDEARAFHGAYWHNGFGYPRSHGCVNMSPGDAQWLFNWAEIGDWIYVHDPSGQTPTDPSLYTSGGA